MTATWKAAWWTLIIVWMAMLFGVRSARVDVEKVKADIEEVRANVWCPKLYRGMRLEWSGETHLYNSTARTFSCRYTRSNAT